MGGVAVFDSSLRDAGEAQPSRFFDHQYCLQLLGAAKRDEVSASKTPARINFPQSLRNEMKPSTGQRASDEVPFLSDDEKDIITSPRTYSWRVRWAYLLPYSGLLNIALVGILLGSWALRVFSANKASIPNEVYSPAQSAVEYKTVVFSGGLREDTSKFVGSGTAVDEEWDTLYNDVLISQIDSESAAKLPNATSPFTHDPNQYIVELDVFHQLHCVNMLRKLVYPKVYPIDLTSGTEQAEDNVFHMEHCYEQLRQSVQCSSDIATIYWQWSESKQKMLGSVRTTHTCKNFDKIRDWAVAHKAQTDLDFDVHVHGAPLHG